MRRHHAVECIGHRGYLAGSPDAAHVTRLRLEDVDGVSGQQFGVLVNAGIALASGNRNVDLACHFHRGVDVLVRGWFLEPGGLEFGDGVSNVYRLGHAEPAVALDHDLHVGPNRFAHRAHDVDGEMTVFWRHGSPCGAKRIELQGLVALVHDKLRPLGE